MDGENLGKLSSRELERLRREKVGYVFQSFHLLPTLNAFENVEFSAQLVRISQKERKRRVHELLELVGMNHRAKHLPNSLSGGVSPGGLQLPGLLFTSQSWCWQMNQRQSGLGGRSSSTGFIGEPIR